MANRKGSWIDFPGAFTAVAVLGGCASFLVVAWPTVAFHGNARWIGEGLWVGIPGACAAAIFMTHQWQTRDERKLARLRNDRLWAEGRHPAQLAMREAAERQERKQLLAEQRRSEAQQARRAASEEARLRKLQLREEIEYEERLRQDRRRKGRSGDLAD